MALEPIKWRSKIILVKPEPLNAYGVDAVPTGAVNAMLMTNVSLQPMEGQDVSRNLERPYMGAQQNIPVGLYSVLTGDTELVGSGQTGVAPGWSPLMRMGGAAEVITPDGGSVGSGKVEYTPITQNQESGSVYIQIGPNRYVMPGAKASGQLTLNASGIPVMRWTITGLFTLPAVAVRPTVDLTKWQKPQVASKANTPTFTIDGVAHAMREFGFNMSNDVQPSMLINHESIDIVDKAEQISVTVRAVPMNVYNPVTSAGSPTADAPNRVIILEHGTIAGKRVRFEAQSAVQRRFGGSQDNQGVEEWPLVFDPLPVAGDDQWKITLT